ncbi:MAG: hypothetical protein WCR42_01415 [bacterium]
MQLTTIDSLMDEAETLDLEDQILFVDLFQKRINERKRNEIAKNGKATLHAIESKKAKIGSVNDFLKELGN